VTAAGGHALNVICRLLLEKSSWFVLFLDELAFTHRLLNLSGSSGGNLKERWGKHHTN
jgi:hypothetical protein